MFLAAALAAVPCAAALDLCCEAFALCALLLGSLAAAAWTFSLPCRAFSTECRCQAPLHNVALAAGVDGTSLQFGRPFGLRFHP